MTKNQLIKTYQQLADLEASKRQVEKEADSLKAQILNLKSALALEIPPNTTAHGITHKVTTRSSVSYAKVYDTLLKTVIPKTKATEAEAIKASHTSTVETHTFKQELSQ